MKLSDRLRKAVDSMEGPAKSRSYSGSEVKSVINGFLQAALAHEAEVSCRSPASIKDIRRGDVFISKAFGGKVRPWVVLSVSDGHVDAVALSSSQEGLRNMPSQCRLWPANWLGGGIAAFAVEQATSEVTRPYTNLRHLDEVEDNLRGRLKPQKPQSIGDILDRLRSGSVTEGKR